MNKITGFAVATAFTSTLLAGTGTALAHEEEEKAPTFPKIDSICVIFGVKEPKGLNGVALTSQKIENISLRACKLTAETSTKATGYNHGNGTDAIYIQRTSTGEQITQFECGKKGCEISGP